MLASTLLTTTELEKCTREILTKARQPRQEIPEIARTVFLTNRENFDIIGHPRVVDFNVQ